MTRNVIFLLLLFLGSFVIFPSFVFAETTCYSSLLNQTTKIYSDASGCHASTGLGFNTTGGAYKCGPVSCPGANDGKTLGRNCIFTEANAPGQCGSGFTNTVYGGFNPSDQEGGCHWNGAPSAACTSILLYNHHVKAKVQTASGTALSNISLHVYDNGHNGPDGVIMNTDSNGLIDVQSWSGDHVKIWTSDSNFDHNSTKPIDIVVNTDWACGSDIGYPPTTSQSPCLITQSGPPGSPAPSPQGPQTTISIAVKLPGIPTTNDAGQLQAPLNTTRRMHVELFKATTTTITQSSVPDFDIPYDSSTPPTNVLAYDPNTGFFTATTSHPFNLGSSIPNGDYQIFIKVPRYLRKQIIDSAGNKTFTLTQGQITAVPQTTLIPGDVASIYNQLDLQDFNALRDCYGSTTTSVKSSCGVGLAIADLDDDGKVDAIDINIFLIGLRMLLIDQQSTSDNGDGPLGP